MEALINKIFSCNDKATFEALALELFDYQMENNPIYAPYAALILKGKTPANIYEIPFLPIEFFKQELIID